MAKTDTPLDFLGRPVNVPNFVDNLTEKVNNLGESVAQAVGSFSEYMNQLVAGLDIDSLDDVQQRLLTKTLTESQMQLYLSLKDKLSQSMDVDKIVDVVKEVLNGKD